MSILTPLKERLAAGAARGEALASQALERLVAHPKVIAANGVVLRGLARWKRGVDRGFEQSWESVRLPSALDIDRVYERLGDLEGQLARLERQLGVLASLPDQPQPREGAAQVDGDAPSEDRSC